MATKLISYDKIENLLGHWDQEESTNRGELKAAKAALRAALFQELTQRQRQCVQLYFYEKLTEEETGRRLGVSKSTVCRHLQKAKRRLGRAVSYAGAARFSLPGKD